MSANMWEKLYGASRRRKDRALLAAMEREIANEEKLRASPAYQADVAKMKRWTQEVINETAPCVDDDEKARIARAFGRPN